MQGILWGSEYAHARPLLLASLAQLGVLRSVSRGEGDAAGLRLVKKLCGCLEAEVGAMPLEQLVSLMEVRGVQGLGPGV